MSEAGKLRDRIHEANVAVHRIEASYYELFHPEVYNRQEQKRITAALTRADRLVYSNKKKALDFGAGTGNLTGKLLDLGYTVTAVDISAEMCKTLKKKFKREVEARKLDVINSPIEDVDFAEGSFDLVACYSVLHHLPDYEGAVHKLCLLLKSGGVMYMDHEASPYYWRAEPSMLGEIVKALYLHSNPIINSFYFRMVGFNVPNVDYGLSDYWYKKEHSLDHKRIQQVFQQERFQLFERTDYYARGTWVPNPLFSVYRRVCRPETSCWIAKK